MDGSRDEASGFLVSHHRLQLVCAHPGVDEHELYELYAMFWP